MALIRGTPNERVVWPWPVRSEVDHITRSKTARGAIADPDFHLPRETKNVLSPGCRVPIAPKVRRETGEYEVGTRLKRDVVALLGWQREIFKMGLAVVARIYPYDLRVLLPTERSSCTQKHASRHRRRRNLWHSCSARFHRNVKIFARRSAALAPSAVVPLCSQKAGPCR